MLASLRSRVHLLGSHGWLLVWLAPVVAAYWARGLLPIDETRYLSVAWEMWLRGDLLVPYLNGEPYAHKPPLLFWLMHAGWALAGVNEGWPRLISPLSALAGLLMTRALARRLWPGQTAVATMAPWLLAGALLWALWTTVTMFDMLLSALMLAAASGLVVAQGRRLPGWTFFAVACGLGILTKGPVALVYAVPPALLAPWWGENARARPLAWYGGLASALLAGVGLALAWALPAADSGGALYAQALLWNQTTERLVESFAHARPLWWYLAWLPAILAPWALWPPLWRALASVRRRPDDGVRFCIAWTVPAFAVLSLISQKQPYYLLPLLPGAALLGARALGGHEARATLATQLPPAIPMLLAAVVLSFPNILPQDYRAAWLGPGVHPLGALALVGLGAALLRPHASARAAVAPMVAVTVAALIVVQVMVFRAAGPAADARPVARRLAALERTGAPLAHTGKYAGEFHFLGRLRAPLEIIGEQGVPDWLRAHPGGRVVLRLRERSAPGSVRLELVQPFRNGWVAIASAGAAPKGHEAGVPGGHPQGTAVPSLPSRFAWDEVQ